jgi:hypothetical protein
VSGRSKQLIAALLFGTLAFTGQISAQVAPVPTMANAPNFAAPTVIQGSSATLGAPVPVLENTLQPVQGVLSGTQSPLIAPAGGTAYPPSALVPPPPPAPATGRMPLPATIIPSSTSSTSAPIRLTQADAPLPPPAFGTPPPVGAPGGPPALPPPPAAGSSNSNMAWWEDTKDALALNNFSKRKLFQSDHAFDVFSSPISSPFLFQDPRSLTQIKPLFLYNHIPSSNPVFNGGNIYWFGVQGSVAITEKLSLKIDKFGGVWMDSSLVDSGGSSLSGSQSSFSEVWLTPQWTFLRNERTHTVLATGLQIQIPAGSDVGQNSGGASLNPYFSAAQNMFRTSYGSINLMGTIGVPISVNGDRTTYFNTNLHVDYDIANMHKWYPTLEMNLMSFLGNGNVVPINTNSGDLFNVGASEVKGLTNLTLAPGLRYKFTENFQIGGAFEFLCTSRRAMEDFRFMLDFIVRY